MADDSKPKKKTVSTRLPEDDYDRLKAYCEDQGISQADALRRFITGREHVARDGHRMSAPSLAEVATSGAGFTLLVLYTALALLAGGYLL